MLRRLVLLVSVTVLVMVLSVGVLNAQSATINGFTVTYGGSSYNESTDRTTFTYTVSGTNTPPDLSHFDIQIPVCETALEVVAYSPVNAVSFGADPTTGVDGIKWDLPLKVNETRVYAITFAGDVSEGNVTVAVKGGPGFESAVLPGPSCTEAAIEVIKSVSVDGGTTWNDAELPTGPSVDVGAPVSFLFQVVNTGDFALSNITLTDSVLDLSSCAIPATLDVEGTFECVVGPVAATEGQHVNIATVTGDYDDETFTDTDAAHYYGGDLPLLSIEKLVAVEGSGTWFAADSAPGLVLSSEQKVQFRIVVTNDGTVPFTNVTLTDDKVDASGCAVPTTLGPGENFECVLGPFEIEEGAQVNTATVTAQANGTPVLLSDSAHYSYEEKDADVIIIVEGPVESIIGNVIVIYGVEITVSDDDPMITVIKVGDFIRIEGEMFDTDGVVVIIPIIIVIVDVDVYVIDGLVWRDDGNCGNPPPPWAPAYGWRRKCGAAYIIIEIGGGMGKGMGMGMGMGDDDDD